MSGFIKIHRGLFSHPALQSPASVGGAWLILLAQARWPEGALSTSYEVLAKALGWNVISAKRLLIRLRKAGLISFHADKRLVTITIIDRSTFTVDGCSGNGPGAIEPVLGWVGSTSKPVLGYGREPIPASVRKAVFERDGSACTYCGDTDGPFDLDHITPVALGGDNSEGNLTVSCKPCNLSKGATPLEEWGGRFA